MTTRGSRTTAILAIVGLLGYTGATDGSPLATRTRDNDRQPSMPRNVVIILSDDHRYDFMGFMQRAPGFLQTPQLDRMAAGGMRVRSAFVTTALCSPRRASTSSKYTGGMPVPLRRGDWQAAERKIR